MFEIIELNWQTVLFVVVTLLWWGEFVLFRSQEAGGSAGTEKDRRSFYVIAAAIALSITLAIIFRLAGPADLHGNSLGVAQQVAAVVYLFGLGFRYWSLILLGDYFTRDVEVQEGQQLVSKGPYRYLRHPSYLGLFLLTGGVLGFIGNVVGIALGLPALLAAFSYRMGIEEEMMADMIGEKYVRWCRGRYRMFPLIY